MRWPMAVTFGEGVMFMSEKQWYEKSENVLYQLPTDITHEVPVEFVAHQLDDGTWEYAVVFRWHGSCELLAKFSRGQMTFDSGY